MLHKDSIEKKTEALCGRAQAFNLSALEAETSGDAEAGRRELKASLVYKCSSKTVRAITQQNPVLKKKEKKMMKERKGGKEGGGGRKKQHYTLVLIYSIIFNTRPLNGIMWDLLYI